MPQVTFVDSAEFTPVTTIGLQPAVKNDPKLIPRLTRSRVGLTAKYVTVARIFTPLVRLMSHPRYVMRGVFSKSQNSFDTIVFNLAISVLSPVFQLIRLKLSTATQFTPNVVKINFSLRNHNKL